MSYFKYISLHNLLMRMLRKIKYVTYFCKIKLIFFIGIKKIKTSTGIFMSINNNDKTFIYCAAGLYDRYFYDLISYLKYEFYFIDVGANQGLYTIQYALQKILIAEKFLHLNLKKKYLKF